MYQDLHTQFDNREERTDLNWLAKQRGRDVSDVQQPRVIKDRDGNVITGARRWKYAMCLNFTSSFLLLLVIIGISQASCVLDSHSGFTEGLTEDCYIDQNCLLEFINHHNVMLVIYQQFQYLSVYENPTGGGQ